MPKNPEPVMIDAQGNRTDAAFHNALLENTSASIAADYLAIKGAVEGGVSMQEAVRRYASPETRGWLIGRGVRL